MTTEAEGSFNPLPQGQPANIEEYKQRANPILS